MGACGRLPRSVAQHPLPRSSSVVRPAGISAEGNGLVMAALQALLVPLVPETLSPARRVPLAKADWRTTNPAGFLRLFLYGPRLALLALSAFLSDKFLAKLHFTRDINEIAPELRMRPHSMHFFKEPNRSYVFELEAAFPDS